MEPHHSSDNETDNHYSSSDDGTCFIDYYDQDLAKKLLKKTEDGKIRKKSQLYYDPEGKILSGKGYGRDGGKRLFKLKAEFIDSTSTSTSSNIKDTVYITHSYLSPFQVLRKKEMGSSPDSISRERMESKGYFENENSFNDDCSSDDGYAFIESYDQESSKKLLKKTEDGKIRRKSQLYYDPESKILSGKGYGRDGRKRPLKLKAVFIDEDTHFPSSFTSSDCEDSVLVTPSYLSPFQILGNKRKDHEKSYEMASSSRKSEFLGGYCPNDGQGQTQKQHLKLTMQVKEASSSSSGQKDLQETQSGHMDQLLKNLVCSHALSSPQQRSQPTVELASSGLEHELFEGRETPKNLASSQPLSSLVRRSDLHHYDNSEGGSCPNDVLASSIGTRNDECHLLQHQTRDSCEISRDQIHVENSDEIASSSQKSEFLGGYSPNDGQGQSQEQHLQLTMQLKEASSSSSGPKDLQETQSDHTDQQLKNLVCSHALSSSQQRSQPTVELASSGLSGQRTQSDHIEQRQTRDFSALSSYGSLMDLHGDSPSHESTY